jgi:hypothetical protein
MSKLRLPSPALVVAMIALAVSLGGTSVAATSIVKRALFANNAGKLQGKTATQVAALPGPATSGSGLIGVRTQALTLAPGQQGDFAASCASNERVISGGFTSQGSVHPWDTRPTDDRTWGVYLVNTEDQALGVTLYAVCIR